MCPPARSPRAHHVRRQRPGVRARRTALRRGPRTGHPAPGFGCPWISRYSRGPRAPSPGRGPGPRTRRSTGPSRPPRPHSRALVEWLLLGADHLVGLVPFPGEEKRVARPRLVQCRGDRLTAIGNPEMTGAAHAGLDVVDDGIGIFGAGIV